jgi:hypothetical protein
MRLTVYVKTQALRSVQRDAAITVQGLERLIKPDTKPQCLAEFIIRKERIEVGRVLQTSFICNITFARCVTVCMAASGRSNQRIQGRASAGEEESTLIHGHASEKSKFSLAKYVQPM